MVGQNVSFLLLLLFCYSFVGLLVFLTETNPLSRETRDVHQFVFHLVYCCFGFGFGWLLIGVMIVHKDRHICNTTLLISFLSETLSNDNVPNWCFHVVLSRDAVPLSTPSVVVVLGRVWFGM